MNLHSVTRLDLGHFGGEQSASQRGRPCDSHRFPANRSRTTTTPESADHEANISAGWECPGVSDLGSLPLMGGAGSKVRKWGTQMGQV